MSLLMNYVELKEGTPLLLHFTDQYMVDREIWDKDLGKPRIVRSLVLSTDEVDGELAFKSFSVLSTKLYNLLSPYLPDNAFRDYTFRITKSGKGFLTDFQVEAIPRPAP
ncbi:MAG: hypothetical protein MUP81_01655 [Dehalococcoidia bacterium]|nr:hypothetical protein [Dehalococcoidia bacterium]